MSKHIYRVKCDAVSHSMIFFLVLMLVPISSIDSNTHENGIPDSNIYLFLQVNKFRLY